MPSILKGDGSGIGDALCHFVPELGWCHLVLGGKQTQGAVSYTHLTLPTMDSV